MCSVYDILPLGLPAVCWHGKWLCNQELLGSEYNVVWLDLLTVHCNRPTWLRDWSRSWFVVRRGRPSSCALGTSRRRTTNHSGVVALTPDRPWSIPIITWLNNVYYKIHPKSPPNLAMSPTCLHCDVTHLSLTPGVVALHIPSWRIEVPEERRQARKIVWPVNAGRVICRHQNNLCGIINHHKHIRYCFLDV